MNTAHNRETYPLTPLQVGMLFHALANMGSGVDVEQIICSIHEPLHIEAFQRAWSRIVERHAVLRSQFEWEEISEPRQVVIPGVPFKGKCFDWKHLSKLDQEKQLDKFIQEDRAQGFNLARMPLMRLAIFELGNEEYKFIWTFHHILLDGRAFPLILEEVFSFYEAFVENRDIEMDGPRPFRDYVTWVGERDLAKDERFWRENLAGFTSPTPLVVGTSLAAGKRNMGSEGVVESRMPVPLTSALRHLASSHGLSMNTLVEGAWALLLSRYNHEDDILYGTTRSCRRASVEGAESMIGLLINTVPVRVRILQQTKMIDWLKQLREQHSRMREYIHSPLYEIQRWSDMTHGSPLFESLVVFENYYLNSFMRSKGGRWVNREFEYRGRTNYPLTLIGYDDDELILRIEFDEERFSQDTVKRILGHLQTILQSMPGNLDNRVADIPILTEAERHQLLVQWNPSQVDYPVDGCLHELFEKQVKRSPDALAMVFENQQLTYRELNRRANQLAHYLRKLGVGPDVLVGLFMERSVEMVIAILGILKAGGAYVPLDPIYPKDRLSFMLEDMQASVIVAQQALAASLPSNSAKIIYFEALEAKSEFHDADAYENPVSGVKADNLAYVIYTSGSTGKPKGVLITHANVMRLFAATDSWFHIGQEDVWTMFHSYAFDFSVWELWGPLLYGGRLVVVSYEVSRSPKAFYELLKKEGVTVLNQTPSAFKQLIDAEESLGNEDGLSLRLIIFGGEALELNSLKPWVKRHGDKKPQLINMYGITETTVHVTYRPITIEDIERGRGSVIGIPIPDLQVYVLDRYLQPVPIGVSGEMYVGGTGLARGYLNRPELTNERFVPNPFSNTKGGRLYKSGDLARYLPDQDLEYLGRIDHQVKIRGFRVELGEIESVLGGHEDVREVMVMAREDVPGDKRLVAYIVPEGEQTPSVSVLRQYLKEKLPEYMVPNAFVMLEKFLLTPNGKIDRRALPAPEHTRPELEAGYVAPQTPVEQSLAEIWANVLGLERVGVNDNFFELGGDSILAIQIISKANQAGLRLTPKDIFGYQTIAELASVAELSSSAVAEQGIVTGPLPLTPIQHWFLEQDLAEPHHWNQAILLEVRQGADPIFLERAVEHLLVHHDALRLRFVREGSCWKQINAGVGDPTPFLRIELLGLSEEKREVAIKEAAAKLQADLNLSDGPILRVALLDFGANESSRILIVIHHLAVDGVSWRILLEDLQTGYGQLTDCKKIELPAKTTSYKHWAERLREYAKSQSLLEELGYWIAESKRQIAPLPVDYSGGLNTEASASSVTVSLSRDETQALLREVPKAYHTQINDVLLTALAGAFFRSTGKRSLLIDLEGHGREDIFEDVDLTRTVGWFTTIFPVFLDLGTTIDPGERLKSVKEQLRRIPNRGFSYGLVRYFGEGAIAVERPRSASNSEIIFNYLGQFDQVLSESSLFRRAEEPIGQMHSLQGHRTHLLEINGVIEEGQLQLNWAYSENIHRRSTVETLAQSFMDEIHALIAHCLSPETGGYTPSDFPESNLTQEELEDIFAEFGETI